jgi:hypothetical protein
LAAATAASTARALRRAGLLATVLAVIAGFLGMHILAGFHAGHSAAGHSAASHGTTTHAAPAEMPTATAGSASCVCQGGCAEKPAAHIGCTPAPPGAAPGAPLPGTSALMAQPRTVRAADLPASRGHLPGTPTPGELCISRT